MTGPSTDTAPSELWQKLQENPAPSEVVDFPRKGTDGKPIGKVRIQVLEMPDHDWARIEARKWVKDKGLEPEDFADGAPLKQVYGDAVARHLLSRAVVDEDPIEGSEVTPGGIKYGRPFPTPEHLDILTADELNVLFSAYLVVQDKFGPYVGNIQDEAELTGWIRRLAEGADPLARFTWLRLVELSCLLAKRAYSLSACLAFLCSNSPNTSVSLPPEWGVDTSSFGAQRANAFTPGLIPVPDGGEAEPPAGEDPDDDPLLGVEPGEPVTIEDVARVSARLGFDGAIDEEA